MTNVDFFYRRPYNGEKEIFCEVISMKKWFFLLCVVIPALTIIFLYHALEMAIMATDDKLVRFFLPFFFAFGCGIAVVFEIDWIYSAFYFFTKTWKKARWKTVLNIVAVSLTFLSILSIGAESFQIYIPLKLNGDFGDFIVMFLSFHFATRVAYIILLIIEKCSQPKTVITP